MESPAFAGTARGQFFHVEKYSIRAAHRKAGGNNIMKIACEAERVRGHCPHVAQPVSPVVLHGVRPLVAAGRSREWALAKFTPYRHVPSGTVKRRRYRQDQPCALVGVISAPPEMNGQPVWARFKAKALVWLKSKFGDRLHSVVEHVDEPQPHIHFWVIADATEDFSAVHPGLRAIQQLGPAASRLSRDLAYKGAMSALQDEFFNQVAGGFGLLRTTVGGKRLTRRQLEHKRAQTVIEEAAFQRGVASAASATAALQRTVNELKECLARERAAAQSLRNGAAGKPPRAPAKPFSVATSVGERLSTGARTPTRVAGETSVVQSVASANLRMTPVPARPGSSSPSPSASTRPTPYDALRKPSPWRG